MTLNETFFSVQGEGRFAGLPMQFVRAYGCNLDCSWCDQPSALTTRPQTSRFYEMDDESIAELIARHPLDVPACFTGGEPFLQSQHLWEIQKLVRQMDKGKESRSNNGKRRLLTVETNGTFFLDDFQKEFYLSMSPKFDQMADRLLDLAEETVITPLIAHGEIAIGQWIRSQVPMHFKFVVTGEKQFASILDWVQRLVPNLLRRGMIPIYFQPEHYGYRDKFGKEIIQKWVECERWRQILDMGFEEVRFIPQIHKILHVR
jgi:organic radical activating enzyme